MDFDYSALTDEKSTEISGDILTKLSAMAEEQLKAEKAVADAEEVLKKKTEILRDIAERQIPDMMNEVGMQEFKTKSGLVIKVKETLHASVSGDKGQQGISWLDENGHGDLIKRCFVVEFKKDEEKWANKFASDLRKRKRAINVVEKKDVHNRTLVSFLTERLEEGENIPLEMFSAFFKRTAKVSF